MDYEEAPLGSVVEDFSPEMDEELRRHAREMFWAYLPFWESATRPQVDAGLATTYWVKKWESWNLRGSAALVSGVRPWRYCGIQILHCEAQFPGGTIGGRFRTVSDVQFVQRHLAELQSQVDKVARDLREAGSVEDVRGPDRRKTSWARLLTGDVG